MTGWQRRVAQGLGGAVAAYLTALVLAYAIPLPERLHSPSSTVVLWADGTEAHIFLSPDEKVRVAVDLDRVDPEFQAALLALEDSRFYLHPGVDPIAVTRAVLGNLLSGRRVSGASTITMQLARLLEPRPRTWSSKLVEALRAVQLELRLSKREILQAYLTFVPYGGNLEGVEGASFAYFGHSARDLSAEEISALLAVPQAPGRRAPSSTNRVRLQAGRDFVAGRLAADGALPLGGQGADEVLARVRAAPVPTRIQDPPRRIPHAARWVRARHPGVVRVATTLQRGPQEVAERAMAADREELARKGIFNGTLLVVDHATREIVALVGNLDFFDAAHAGQMPAFLAPRSPGSALKPLVFSLALDRGIALPEQLVPDVPIQYGTYAPENYDGRFDGVVTLGDALSRSLNVPFVTLLSQVTVPAFLGALRAQGAAHLDWRPGHYGLSAAVGGIELSPLEMTAIYATLAQDGRYAPLRITQGVESRTEVAIYAPGAAYRTREVLAIRDRPDFPSRVALSSAPRRIHWKTGTSFGNRDAWAIGSGRRYTTAVWLGNLDRTPSVHLIGAEAAGPVLFDVLEGLADGHTEEAVPPRDLAPVSLCALSGHLPTEACPTRREALALVSATPTTRCPYHRAVTVEVESGRAVAPGCRGDREVREDTYVVWPASVRRWLGERAGLGRPLPPPAPGCEAAFADALVILSPAPSQTILLVPGVPAVEQELALEADGGPPGAVLSWFVDGALIGRATAEERVWWAPVPGEHEVAVVDPGGAAAKRTFVVRAGE